MSAPLAWICAAAAAAGLLALLLRGPLAGWLDQPNARSLHARPVPRIGGIALHAAWLAAALASAAAWGLLDGPGAWRVLPPALGGLLVFAVSLRDDRGGVGPLARLAVQSIAAALLVGTVGMAALAARPPWPAPTEAGALAAAVVFLAALWAMNLYNFMDGADGLAGGMALFGFGAYAAAAWPQAPLLAIACAAISGAAAGFLVFNFPPARVFMGDAGSVPLGFLAAALGLAGIAAGAWGWWLPPLAFLPFAVDATATLVRRAARGERLWEAHRQHAYQKLILLGLGRRRSVLAWWAAMATCAAACVALAGQPAPVQWAALGVATAVLLAAGAVIESAWRRAAGRPSRASAIPPCSASSDQEPR